MPSLARARDTTALLCPSNTWSCAPVLDFLWSPCRGQKHNGVRTAQRLAGFAPRSSLCFTTFKHRVRMVASEQHRGRARAGSRAPSAPGPDGAVV